MASHLVVFYAATTGATGPLLGSDEEDIVFLQYLIWDVNSRKALFEQQYIVRPPESSDDSEKTISQKCREDFELSDEYVKAGESLESAIMAFENICRKLIDEGKTICAITDGQLHLRQVLHPKASSISLELPEFYDKFFDIRKEFRNLYQPPIELKSITEIVNYLEINEDDSTNIAIKSVRQIAEVITKMTSEGHIFINPEVINLRLEPGICTRSEEVDSGCVVRARGLPWQSSDQDIAKFFRGLNIAKGGVALCLSPQGRRNGEALVRFVSPEHRDMALKRHKHHIASRYIEVYKATGEDFINVAGGNSNEAQQFLSRGGNVIIRMRGLPYDCTAKQVVEFFEAGDNGCPILDDEDGVLFVKKPDGRATGDAFVLFASEDDSAKALAKHREIIGSRYIELFRSTTAEVQQVLNRSMDPRTYEQQQPLIAQLPQMPILPPHLITSSSRKDCIRLRGLPYEAQVEHVLDFLGEYAQNIVYQGVHMVINPQGQPSGEAFIQMNREQSAFEAAHNRHNRYMVFGKKQRYIEVFQCSGEDMAFVMSAAVQPQRTVVSPGMLMWDQATAAGAGLSPSTSVPGLFPPLRPPLSGSSLPFIPPALPQTANGSQVANLTSLPIKPETLLNPNAIALRSPLMQPGPLELAQMSQPHQNNHLLSRSGIPVSNPSTAIPTSLLNSYVDLALQSQVATTAAAHQGMMLLPSVPKLPGALYHNFNHNFPLVAVSSADNKSNPLQPKNTLANMFQMQYASSAALQAATMPSGSNKRPYEQAFAGDKNSALNQLKRAPPRLPHNHQINPGQLLPMPGTNPLFAPAIPTQQLGALHPQQMQTFALNPSLILYPQAPHMYPSM